MAGVDMVTVPIEIIEENLNSVRTRISQLCDEVGRDDDVTIIAVTKTHSVQTVRNVIDLGIKNIGENKYQEMRDKESALDDEDVVWHFIGRIQSNKCERIAALADVVHSVCSREQIDIIARGVYSPKVCIQISGDGNSERGGVTQGEFDGLLAYAREHDVEVIGTMMVAPLHENPKNYFLQTAHISRENGLPLISMGMSGDYEVAVACGATHVRLGSTLLGNRR